MLYIYGASPSAEKLVLNKFKEIFSPENLQKIAGRCGFYKRSGCKITPAKFFDVQFDRVSEKGYISLNQSAVEFKNQYKVQITKQAFDQRFNQEAVEFFKQLLEETISKQLGTIMDSNFLLKFKRVLIKDGTRFDLPENLREYFKGFGGTCTSAAALCIQYEFDLKTMKFVDFKLTDAIVPDISEAKITTDKLKAGDLFLRDLGYFYIKTFKEIAAADAYFLSRLQTKTNVYVDNKKLCFKTLYENMGMIGQTTVEKYVEIGEKERFVVRLIADIVPEEIYQERIRTLEKTAKKKGYTLSDETRYRARFFLLVTNIEAEMVSNENLFKTYRLRWQIELMFKRWKSKLGINITRQMKYHRFMCMILTKLLYLVVVMEIISLARKKMYDKIRKILSIDKCFDTIQKHLNVMGITRNKKRKKALKEIKKLFGLFEEDHWQEKRKNRDNFEEIFDLLCCITNN